MLKELCFVDNGNPKDRFVGIKCTDGKKPNFYFPLGYNLSVDDDGIRKDILLLIATLEKHTDKQDSSVTDLSHNIDKEGFPIQSYIYIVKSFLMNGYYFERNSEHKISKTGKINWSRTIKTQKPHISGKNIVYLDFVTKKNAISENEIITQIHKYCVEESFKKIGWLFSLTCTPTKPTIKFDKNFFLHTINTKLATTYNDGTKTLFKHMLNVINYLFDSDAKTSYKYGTYRFEYIWESMIDKIFGIPNKSNYFPNGIWHFTDGKTKTSATLRPDTIMLYENDVYVLDAKYYKFGITKRSEDLPETTSINKQITYGEHIDTDFKLRQEHGQAMVVYNAFIMPYDATDWGGYKIKHTCYATSTWKSADESKPYTHVQGILYDIKRMMTLTSSDKSKEIAELATLIKEHAVEQVYSKPKVLKYLNPDKLVEEHKAAETLEDFTK